MLTKLHLQNFRRHEDTEIIFSPDAQIVLIDGQNGVGKTSILEAVLYAFYGQGRNGKKNLDNLVRRDAVLEGMQVECGFTIGETEYSIVRRREGKAATAILYGNGQALSEGSDQVSREVANLLGMDAAGFKLAVIAQQKELDGLASLRPAERAAMLSRLLRLDVITKAKDEARKIYRQEKEIVRALGQGADLPSLDINILQATDALLGTEEALKEASLSLKKIEAQLEESKVVEDAFEKAQREMSHAKGMLLAGENEQERLTKEQEDLHIPILPLGDSKDLEILQKESVLLERTIVQAETAKEAANQYNMLSKENNRVKEDLSKANERIVEIKNSLQKDESLEEKIFEKNTSIFKIQTNLESIKEKHAGVRAESRLLQNKLKQSQALDAICESCGQKIDEKHKKEQISFQQKQLKELTDALKKLQTEEKTLYDLLQETVSNKEKLTKAFEEKKQLEKEQEQLAVIVEELERRQTNYSAQLNRLTIESFDLDELYAKRGELAAETAEAKKTLEIRQEIAQKLALKQAIDTNIKRVAIEIEEAVLNLENNKITVELQKAYEKRILLLNTKDQELQLHQYLATEKAVQEEKVNSAKKIKNQAEAGLKKRVEHEEKAAAAAGAARLLDDVESRLSTQIRPALEGSVTEVLNTLSEGRFSKVEIDTEYNISVLDDGKNRPITEFSGGEMDLIALAVRLALAEIVSDRHGSGNGFLILDECFGSQDSGRREAIMNALRNLKTIYGQILLISHVGGLEELADSVIKVSPLLSKDGERTAEVKIE